MGITSQSQNLTEKSVEENVDNLPVREYTITIDEEKVNKAGKEVMGMTVNGSIPGPTLIFTEGEYAVIYVKNNLKEETSVHWHGLLLPNFYDGVPYLTTPPIDKTNGKASPYGVYDIQNNRGWVNVGTSSDTAAFAVSTIRDWWEQEGSILYPSSNRLYINADGGGSNGSRNLLWKAELQQFSNDSGLSIHVSHFPTGTSKWNKIEHRLFAYISKNWRAKPLTSLLVIISLIGATTTTTGLIVMK